MKITCLIILCLTALTLQPAPAAETNSTPATINEQLRDIDLKLALERYEKLQRQLFELRTEIALLPAEENKDAQREAKLRRLHEKADIVSQQAQEARLQALRLGEKKLARNK